MLADANSGNDRPDIEEQYQTASTTSNLKVVAERRGAADVMIAAGWSSSRVGMALLRLHSEWDASEKPRKPSKESIRALVGTYQRALPGEELPRGEKPRPLTASQAQHHAAAWYAHEVAMLLGKLKALPAVRSQATIRAIFWSMQDPATKASEVVRYWLDQSCRTCLGLRWQQVPGTPALSGRPCKACGGTGLCEVPHGQEGKRLANWLDRCVEDARGTVRRNLASYRAARNRVVETAHGRRIEVADGPSPPVVKAEKTNARSN